MTGVARDEIKGLLDSRKNISMFLWDKREQLEALRSTQIVDCVDWVMELADNLTMCARAPAHWAPPRPLHEFKGHPPAPQFEQMRAGWLERYHQKQLKVSKDNSASEKESGMQLLTFKREKSTREPLVRKERSKRGREDDEGGDQDTEASTKKRARGESDVGSAQMQAEEDMGRTRKTATLNFGLDDEDDSDSD